MEKVLRGAGQLGLPRGECSVQKRKEEQQSRQREQRTQVKVSKSALEHVAFCRNKIGRAHV